MSKRKEPARPTRRVRRLPPSEGRVAAEGRSWSVQAEAVGAPPRRARAEAGVPGCSPEWGRLWEEMGACFSSLPFLSL